MGCSSFWVGCASLCLPHSCSGSVSCPLPVCFPFPDTAYPCRVAAGAFQPPKTCAQRVLQKNRILAAILLFYLSMPAFLSQIVRVFGSNRSVIYLSYIYAATQLTPQTIHQRRAFFQPDLICVMIMLQIFRQAVFV